MKVSVLLLKYVIDITKAWYTSSRIILILQNVHISPQIYKVKKEKNPIPPIREMTTKIVWNTQNPLSFRLVKLKTAIRELPAR